MTSHVNGFSFFGKECAGHSCELQQPVACVLSDPQGPDSGPDMGEVSQQAHPRLGSGEQAVLGLGSPTGVKCAQEEPTGLSWP